MVFSSYAFLFYFLPLALGVYLLLPHRARNLGLAALSYLFYGWANPAFVLLMLTSTVIDYLCGRTLAPAGARLPPVVDGAPRSRRQKAAVAVSVTANLGLLGFFKYFDFAVDSYVALAAALGLPGETASGVLRVTLPLGISFYTFQSMSYTLDVYRGHAAPLRSFVDFACYVSLFPQLVAGPIVRFSELADQLGRRILSAERFARGGALLSLGLAKKVLLANPCGAMADLTFGAASVTALDAWTGAVAYSFQIYFDFSGYSDMALGLGLMLGFVLPRNFDAPYRARSLRDFWRRWHISLSRWLRDYLYIPLGGSRRGTVRTYVNLAVVMLLGGLWHGAAWTFVAWGGVHGLGLAVERALGERTSRRSLPAPLGVAGTYLVVLLAWVLFRADSITHAGSYLAAMASLTTPTAAALLVSGPLYTPYHLLCLVTAAVVTWSGPGTLEWSRRLTPIRALVCLALFWLAVAAMLTQGYNPFIYFIF